MKTKLTKKQQAVFNFLLQRIEVDRFAPTYREICRKFGYSSTNAARSMVKALVTKGWVYVEPKISRGIFIND